ncbi:MAG TPA: putative Ig domain-containing protein [Gammaproteobacteria bacterium]|nr:putative Ig domain-containing protein [Gammaproteobacteria bacterium]
MYVRYHAFRIFGLVLLGCALQGCGGDEEAVDPNADSDPDIDVELTGSVGDGPVVGAQLAVRSNAGALVQNAVSSQLAGYNITFKTKGRLFPLFIEATGGTDLVTNLLPDVPLRSAALEPRNRVVANLSPFTTLALATAEQMSGGQTSSNVRTALGTVTAEFNSGLTTLAAGGVMSSTINDSNLPEIVKSSETLAETLRRVNSIRRASGRTSSVDDVIKVVGADLADGKLDGRGASLTDAHASAATVLVSAQVLVEAMTNSLRVNDQSATAALDGAINRLASTPIATPTATQPITAGMIDAARTGTAAASAIVPSPALTALQQALGALTPGMLPAAVTQALPSGAAATLAPALTQITTGAQSDVDAVNAISGGAGVPNSPPTISGSPPPTATVGALYSFTPTAADPEGATLTFAIANLPAWATFNATTGRLSGTPAAANVGTFSGISISVSDGAASTSLPAFAIAVAAAPNAPPTISGSPPTSVTAGALYSFTPTANDPEGATLTFAIANRPAWGTFDTATGRLAGTPTTAGTFGNIVISVSDGTASAALPAFAIAVTAANVPPVISGTPPTTGTVGTAYTFTPTASDANTGQTLTFSIANRPAWATFTASTGRLQGTPTSANVGTFSGITISVSDGQASAQLAPFTITVSNPPNRVPTITGTPPSSVMQGTAYSFQPSASDPDGDTLTFTVANAPAWAAFDSATGRLSGTPLAQHVGTTSGIVITVSDGALTASLPAFAVTVQAVATGSAMLSWTPPTTNTDGSPLTNLAGYKIYWGTQQGTYPNSVTLNNPGLATYVVEGLVPGTYFFVATAVNTLGAESSFSGVASKTIP